jgi:formylglycine-generating enzyme required for sulfatase activity
MKSLRIIVSMVAVILLTSLGVGASDVWQGNSGGLLAQLVWSTASDCPVGMIAVGGATTFRCVDAYEASPSDSCVYQNTNAAEHSISNVADPDCSATARAQVMPWRYISRADAVLMCARSGKRLPTAAEWYSIAIGTQAQSCAVAQSSVANTGAQTACASVYGAHDMVGNVWEWVNDDVIDGQYAGRTVPPSGFIEQFDTGGVSTVTSLTELGSTTKDNGYFWSSEQGAFGMIRGGFYGSKSDAAVTTIHAGTNPNFTGAAVGFRCVR